MTDTERQRTRVDQTARDLLNHLLQLREYEPLSLLDEALVVSLNDRIRSQDGDK